MQTYSPDLRVAVEPFTHQPEAGGVVVGFQVSRVFLVLQQDAFAILEQLSQGRTLDEVKEFYARTYGEVADLDDFVGELFRRKLLKPLEDVEEAPLTTVVPEPDRRPLFSPALARKLFSRPVVVAQLATIGLAVLAVCTDPAILPTRAALFFPDQLALTTVLILLVSVATSFVHEFAHLLAARAAGVKARIGVSHRLWIIVLETDLSGLWSISRRQRALPLIAGPLIDATTASLLLLVLRWNDLAALGFSPQTLHYLKAAALIYVLRLIWQCYLFMRTDFYYVLTFATRCKSLMQDTEDLLRNQLARLSSHWQAVDQSHIPASERRVIRLYTIPWLLGRGLAAYVLLVVQLPLLWQYILAVGAKLSVGYQHNPHAFIDSITVALVAVLSLGGGLYLWIREILKTWRKPYAVAK
ncbi:MAG TPA: hypothetical protein VIE43_19615 [Thermoanaerobaculia bacterium]|nr:hypothetical protein [Thermoanaerobaculia bacterium]